MIEVGWIIYAIVAIVVVFVSYQWVSVFSYPRELEWLTGLACFSGVALVLLCTGLIPVDIYLVSILHNNSGEIVFSLDEINQIQFVVRVVYYVIYSCILFVAFFLLPLAYFYHEEEDIGVSNADRLKSALKYTLLLLVILVVLLVLGVVIQIKQNPPTSEHSWMKDIFKSEKVVDGALNFSIAVFAALGFLCFISYTSYGLSALPLSLVKSGPSVNRSINFRELLEVNKEKQRAIKDKYQFSRGKTMTSSEQKKLRQLQQEQRNLERQATQERPQGFCFAVLMCLRPFSVILGIAWLLANFLMMITLFLSSLDRTANSLCGFDCGYILDKPTYPNPIDNLLVYFSPYFPVDLVIIGFIVMDILVCTIYGLYKLGVRLLWIQLYSLRIKRSVPQSMILSTVTLMLTIIATNFVATTLAPQYTAFGQQRYLDKDNIIKECAISSPSGECFMTELYTLVSRVSLKGPIFAVLFLGANICISLWMCVIFIYKCLRADDGNVDEEEEVMDDEESQFLPNPSSTRLETTNAHTIREKYFGSSSRF